MPIPAFLLPARPYLARNAVPGSYLPTAYLGGFVPRDRPPYVDPSPSGWASTARRSGVAPRSSSAIRPRGR